ncbi:hypothetical protein SAMN05444365_101247 [Micromonospora pattaloongensis]|uniref:DUF5709 domain-containing protein n=1 Tax=Micromonospora pattaloongensis TaxID=405436 RepID=A0A1H3G1R0_9ACTN|nr:DUF5709 domain-containing protein [Micromonospora pattaloongensis]SDX97243.1 hypothetical protein SAMN05444365_101247 [Micromonospora pattaloongensis]
MRRPDSEFPRPVSDPEAEGLPRTADDDSSANDDVMTGRWADGIDPQSLPTEQPQAVDRYGNTADEQRHGESLDYKLAREQGDTLVNEALAAPTDGTLGNEADSEEAARQAQLDADVMGESPTSDPKSPVSLYDHGRLGGVGEGGVGRLVEPDQGIRTDDERDSIARDLGAAGGGPTAEELAMHETEPPPAH